MMVVLDTNFITLPVQFGIDVFSEIHERMPEAELVTVSQVVDELGRLGAKGRIGQEMLRKFGVKVLKKNGQADNALLKLAEDNNGLLCTNDRELKKRALEKKVPVMFMRKKRTLEISGGFDV
jgi:hypothetical protein